MSLPLPAKFAAAAAGDSGSAKALRRLGDHLAAIKAQGLQPLLKQALAALRAGRRGQAAEAALQALEIDKGCGLAWHILAICREKEGNFAPALEAYEQALALMPDEPEIANDLGRLALKMGMADIAQQLFANYVARRPDSVEGVNNLACAQRDLMAFGQAMQTLSDGLQRSPQSALLWNCLGSVLTLQGRMDEAATFYDEALRLEPRFGQARYNRSIVRLALGDAEGAIADLDAAEALAALPGEAAGMKVARAKALLASGQLQAGWDAYQARLDRHYEDAVHFPIDRPAWTPQTDMAGRNLLLIGEQGLGDEVLFAHVLPDLIADAGHVTVAVDPRLAPLFARAFPQATVASHVSARIDHRFVRTARLAPDALAAVDAFAPLGAPLRRYRSSLADFGQGAYLAPNPDRTAHWRAQLAALPGKAVGILWKSLVMDADRIRQFAPFEAWAPVLATPGVTFVNLQYGDSADEAALALQQFGAALWTPPGVDLKDDLDDLAALTCALDLTLGPANATTNIAGACGAPLWLISTPHAWPRLGRPDYPWYPQARVFTPEAYARWEPVMDEIAGALKEFSGA